MSRLSREKKREQKYVGGVAAGVAPLDVHVRGGGTATIGGVPVVAADGEEIQRAVLSRLHRIALATGHPVLAAVHDERIGYVVPLRVETDGSSHFTAEPRRTQALPHAPAPVAPSAPAAVPAPPPAAPSAPAGTREGEAGSDGRGVDSAPAVSDEPRTFPPGRDKATHLLRKVSEPVRDATPTFPLRAVPEPEPTPETTTEPEVQDAVAPLGTVTAPTGVFGPPPAMDEQPDPDTTPDLDTTFGLTATPAPPPPVSTPTPLPLPGPAASLSAGAAAPAAAAASALNPLLPDGLVSDHDPDFRPTPARGFDAVAEAVLGDDPRTLHGVGAAPALLGEPMAQINEAVRAGRTDTAAALAERTVLEASGTLGPEHFEVLRLRELMAYIAYLAGDPLRAFHVSLDLARIGRRAGDAEAAYGNVQSAATAWRAVRDPLQGLNLGTELLALWTELAAEEGPAADDVDELESARARMLRLAERARRAGA
ncbi:tetratricopeptide repeat protein [Streptomyces sp. NPDC058291]|uniref:tetratricopeptide repeat protein n=1 Tax=Streptomyces sp. NPDC058291 TaxID=3346427 RepID=UPI0036E533AF